MPFSPLNLTGLLAWYNPDQSAVTQTNCAKFVRISQNYLWQRAVIGAAISEATGASGVGVVNNDFFDGQWADIVICTADTSSQRTSEEAYQQSLYKG